MIFKTAQYGKGVLIVVVYMGTLLFPSFNRSIQYNSLIKHCSCFKYVFDSLFVYYSLLVEGK